MGPIRIDPQLLTSSPNLNLLGRNIQYSFNAVGGFFLPPTKL